MADWNGKPVVLIQRMNGQETMIQVPYAANPIGGHSPLIYVANLDTVTAELAKIGVNIESVLQSLPTDVSGELASILQALNAMPGSRGKHAASGSFPVTVASDDSIKTEPLPGAVFPVSIQGQTGVLGVLITNTSALSVVQNATAAAGGAATWRSMGLTKSPVQVKAGAGRIYAYRFSNKVAAGLSATDRTIRLYDTVAAPDLTKDKPLLSVGLGIGQSESLPLAPGVSFANGLWAVAVSGILDIDLLTATVASATSGDVVAQLVYA